MVGPAGIDIGPGDIDGWVDQTGLNGCAGEIDQRIGPRAKGRYSHWHLSLWLAVGILDLKEALFGQDRLPIVAANPAQDGIRLHQIRAQH